MPHPVMTDSVLPFEDVEPWGSWGARDFVLCLLHNTETFKEAGLSRKADFSLRAVCLRPATGTHSRPGLSLALFRRMVRLHQQVPEHQQGHVPISSAQRTEVCSEGGLWAEPE